MDLYKPGGSSIRDLLSMFFGKREAPARLSTGTITPVTTPVPPPQVARRRAPAYDNAAMDYLTAPLQEGPNANIDDATRQRALAWALRQQG